MTMIDKSCACPMDLCVRSRTNNTEVPHVGVILDIHLIKVEESKSPLPISSGADIEEV